MMTGGTIGASCQTDGLAASGCIDARGLQFIYRRLEASCSGDGVFGVARDRYLTQPPLAVSAGLGEIRRERQHVDSSSVDSAVGEAMDGYFLLSCATLHCQGSSPASELKLSPENNNALVTEHGTS